MNLTEFKEKLPEIREMFKDVPAIGLGTSRLAPNQTYQNNNRHQIVVDTSYYPSTFLEVLGANHAEKSQDLWERVLYGCPFLIKNLLEYTAELEQKLADTDDAFQD